MHHRGWIALLLLFTTVSCGIDRVAALSCPPENPTCAQKCGDGILNHGEQCDDGNLVADDGCSATCRLEIAQGCGDNILGPGEQCDDGNLLAGDGCDGACRIERCGDGILDPNEQCDDGNNTGGDGCDPNCRIEPRCGDGTLDSNEQCDDGNNASGDGCDPNCRIEPRCGDGMLDSDEQCDDGNTVGGDGCDPRCRFEPRQRCGDGILDPNEQCDDGNTVAGDGCSELCRDEQQPWRCGDGTLDPDEQCDDGNTAGGDGCNAICQVECIPDEDIGILPSNVPIVHRFDLSQESDDVQERCGYGRDAVITFELEMVSYVRLAAANPVYGGLYADTQDDSCTGQLMTCMSFEVGTISLLPGRYFWVAQESSPDSGGIGGPTAITITNLDLPLCGDGALHMGETCDDGNTVGGDGCSADCRSDETCGNGIVDTAEVCDDGNVVGDDGCSADCTSTV